MDDKVLVVYASKYGSTAEIAEAIARRIKESGIDVDVKTALEVERLNGYQGVVLGSAVYAGQWRKEAASFLEDQQEELSTRKVWLFSSGPTGDGDPVELMNGWSFPEGLRPAADRVQVQRIKFFHGVLDEEKLGFAEKLIVKTLQAPLGDYRDWMEIESWADEIAAEFLDDVS